jgi:hypothetical protein
VNVVAIFRSCSLVPVYLAQKLAGDGSGGAWPLTGAVRPSDAADDEITRAAGHGRPGAEDGGRLHPSGL